MPKKINNKELENNESFKLALRGVTHMDPARPSEYKDSFGIAESVGLMTDSTIDRDFEVFMERISQVYGVQSRDESEP